MNIKFLFLKLDHFSLMLKWLNTNHIKLWWDKDINWTMQLIKNKYLTYIKGYALQEGIKKKIQGYIIYIDLKPIGYIQIYNTYDFYKSSFLQKIPNQSASIDIFIGEESLLGLGIGSKIFKEFIDKYCKNIYTHILIDVNTNNFKAIKFYYKLGFKKVYINTNKNELYLLLEVNKLV